MQQQVFPQYETKVIEPVGSRRCSEGVNGIKKLGVVVGESEVLTVDLEPAQHNQTTLPQLNSEVVNLTGLLKTKD